MSTALLAVGRVARAHGLKGEVRVQLHDPDSESLLDVPTLIIGGVPKRILRARLTTGAVLLTIEGIADRDAAEALKGQPVEVERAHVPLEDGQFFLADLVGCTVVGTDGAVLGVAAAILPGKQDLLEIHDRAAMVSRLMPLVSAWIVELDLDARRMVVDVPEDLPTEPLRS